MAIIDTRDDYLFSLHLVKTSDLLFRRIIELIELKIGKKIKKISKGMFTKYALTTAGIEILSLSGKNLHLVPSVRDIKIISQEVYAEARVKLMFPIQGTPDHRNKVIQLICEEVNLTKVSINNGGIDVTVVLGGDYYPIRIPAKKGSPNGDGQPHYVAQCET